MWEIIENSENYTVMTDKGVLLATFDSNSELVPMKWDRKYNTKEQIASTIKKIWGKETF